MQRAQPGRPGGAGVSGTGSRDAAGQAAEVEAAASGSRLKLRVARFGQSAAFAAGLPCGVYPPYEKSRR